MTPGKFWKSLTTSGHAQGSCSLQEWSLEFLEAPYDCRATQASVFLQMDLEGFQKPLNGSSEKAKYSVPRDIVSPEPKHRMIFGKLVIAAHACIRDRDFEN